MYQIMRYRPSYGSPSTLVDKVGSEHQAQVEVNRLNSDAHWDQSPYRYYYEPAR